MLFSSSSSFFCFSGSIVWVTLCLEVGFVDSDSDSDSDFLVVGKWETSAPNHRAEGSRNLQGRRTKGAIFHRAHLSPMRLCLSKSPMEISRASGSRAIILPAYQVSRNQNGGR